MAGIKEIAKACHVSIATVSNVLNEKPGPSENTVKLVKETARKMNYRPNFVAKNLAQHDTRMIGVITEDLTTFTTPEIVDGINEFCEQHRYQIVLGNMRLHKKYNFDYYYKEVYKDQVEEEFQIMMAKQVMGIIYVGGHERRLGLVPENFPLPIVTVYGFTGNPRIPAVIVDDEQGGYDAARYLLNGQEKRLGILAGPQDSFHMQGRLKGVQRALYEMHLCFNPEDVFYGDWERDSGFQGAKVLMDRGIHEIFSMNDMMAGGVYRYVEEQGLKVGEDISLVGFDNREFSTWFAPKLTTICLPLHDLGYQAAQVMVEKLEKKDTKACYKVPCQFIERDSVKRS